MIHDLSTQEGRNKYADAMSKPYPIKMYASKMFNNIKMYKTASLNPRDIWEDFMEHDYNVEVKNDKARVWSNNPFVKKPSRFCKLRCVQQLSGNMRVYQLTVNGYQAFFKIAHIIRD